MNQRYYSRRQIDANYKAMYDHAVSLANRLDTIKSPWQKPGFVKWESKYGDPENTSSYDEFRIVFTGVYGTWSYQWRLDIDIEGGQQATMIIQHQGAYPDIFTTQLQRTGLIAEILTNVTYQPAENQLTVCMQVPVTLRNADESVSLYSTFLTNWELMKVA